MGKVNKLTEKNLCQNNDDFDWTLYENGYLVGAVGIYGGNEKMNNEKAQLAMEMLKGAVQR